MRKLTTLLLILIPLLGYSQIPASEGPNLYGTRHFISLDGADTLAISQGDTARITATDSLFVDKLQGYYIDAGFTGDTIRYTYGIDSVTMFDNTVRMYDNPTYKGWLKNVVVPEKTFNVPKEQISYIAAYWNNGDPEYRLTSDRTDINVSDGVPILTIYRQNGNILTKRWAIGDGMIERVFLKDVMLDRTERVNGFILDTLNSVNVQVSSGEAYYGLQDYDIPYFSSLQDSLYFYSYDGTEWSYTDTTEVVRSYYNPESGLTALGNNRYTTVWFYQAICCPDNNFVFMILGNNQYNQLEDALQDNSQPPNRPDIVNRFGLLIGRMVIQEGATSVEEIQTAFGDVAFSGTGSGGVTDHGNLTGLDDSSDHPWAVEWSDTTSVIASKNWTETAATAANSDKLEGLTASQFLRSDVDDVTIGWLAVGKSSAPTEALDINGNGKFTGNISINNTATNGILELNGGNGGTGDQLDTQIVFGYQGNNTYKHWIQTRHSSSVNDNNAIDFFTSDGTQDGVFPTNGIHGMTISNGKVGINTTSPSEKLDIDGNIKASGTILSNGTDTVATETWVENKGYLTSESDPIFSAHTTSNISDGTGLLQNDGAGNWSYDNSDYLTDYTETDPVYDSDISVQSLSGTSVTFNANNGHNAEITLSGNTTITFSNLVAGTTGNITVDNPSTAYDITFSGYTIIISPSLSPSTDTITMSGGSETDVLSWYYDGTQLIINGTLAYE